MTTKPSSTTIHLGAFFIVVFAGCSRTALELGDGHAVNIATGGGVIGTSGGSSSGGSSQGGVGTVTGGGVGAMPSGGSGGGLTGGTGGSAGMIDPGGPIPDCGVSAPDVPVKERRWLAWDAYVSLSQSVTRYLVEITPDGPQNVSPILDGVTFDFDTNLGTWSADGRYFNYQHTEFARPVSVEVFEVSENAPPVPVSVPVRPRFAHWSPLGAKYYTLPEPAANEDPIVLSVVDVTSAVEKTLEISEFHDLVWSPDARFVTFTGPMGVARSDTAGESLTAEWIYDESSRDPLWSPDGRYLVFPSNRHLQVYDTEDATLETVAPDRNDPQPYGTTWLRNDWISWTANGTWFLDLSRRPLEPIRLPLQNYPGIVSPGAKCVAYSGECPEAFHYGICVRTLPPVPEKPPVVVGYGSQVDLHWSGTGNHLLISDRDEPFLTVIDLAGGPFTASLVTEGTDALGVSGLINWDPAGTSDWLSYGASYPPSRRQWYPRIWHRESRRTSEIDIGGGSFDGGSWSPDGRYLVVAAEFPEETEGTMYVYEVIAGEVRKRWTLSDGTSQLDSWQRHFEWQP